MKLNGKIVKILVGLMLVSTIISTNAAAGLLTNNKSEGLSALKVTNYMRMTLRGKIKDLEVKGPNISFIPVNLVCKLTVNFMGFRHTEKATLDESVGSIEIPINEFKCIYTSKMMWGSITIDLDEFEDMPIERCI